MFEESIASFLQILLGIGIFVAVLVFVLIMGAIGTLILEAIDKYLLP